MNKLAFTWWISCGSVNVTLSMDVTTYISATLKMLHLLLTALEHPQFEAVNCDEVRLTCYISTVADSCVNIAVSCKTWLCWDIRRQYGVQKIRYFVSVCYSVMCSLYEECSIVMFHWVISFKCKVITGHIGAINVTHLLHWSVLIFQHNLWCSGASVSPWYAFTHFLCGRDWNLLFAAIPENLVSLFVCCGIVDVLDVALAS
jgi:hypothetical protein